MEHIQKDKNQKTAETVIKGQIINTVNSVAFILLSTLIQVSIRGNIGTTIYIDTGEY